VPLFGKKEKKKSKAELVAEALLNKIGKEKLDEEATKLYFEGIRDFQEQMDTLAKRYGIDIDKIS